MQQRFGNLPDVWVWIIQSRHEIVVSIEVSRLVPLHVAGEQVQRAALPLHASTFESVRDVESVRFSETCNSRRSQMARV